MALTLAIVMLGAVFAGCTEDIRKKNKAPVAIILTPSDGATLNVGDAIEFSGAGSYDPEKRDLTYFWDFGDGAVGTTMNMTHTYDLGEIYNVSLMVNDGKKNNTAYIGLFINTPPVAVINMTSTMVPIGVNTTFDASESTDADGDPLTYDWDFGNNNTTAGKIVGFKFMELGYYNVTLSVGDGVTVTKDTKAIEVYQPNRPPVADFMVEPSIFNNTDLVIFNASTTTDPDEDTLTYDWAFGDGNISSGMVVEHAFELAGSYTVNLTVSDGGYNDSITKVLGVLQKNRAPLAVINVSVDMGPEGYLSHIGEDITFDAIGSTDADGDPMTFTWNFGDGTNATGDTVTHTFTNIGLYYVNLTVSDWEYDVIATATMDIFPTGEMFIDWDESNYGYIIELDDDVDEFEVEANITDETTSTTDDDYHVSFLNASHTVRLFSSIDPVPGHVLNVTLIYKNRDVVNRVIEVVGQTPVPIVDVDINYEMDMKRQATSGQDESWMNMTLDGKFKLRDGYETRNFTATDSEVYQKEVDGTTVRTMTGTFPGTTFNSSGQYNTEDHTDTFMKQIINMRMTDSGTWAGEMNATAWQKTVDGLTTGMRGTSSGRLFMMGILLNYSVESYDTGFEAHDNGDGENYDCIKLFNNMTLTGHFSMLPILPHDHYAIVNETTTWTIQDSDPYDNPGIYTEYSSSIYLINDSAGGKWELKNNEVGSFYEDEDGNGDFNPDPAILDVDVATEFEGVMPRELRVGDRIATVNTHGAVVDSMVVEEVEMTVSGNTYTVARLNMTYGTLADLSGTGYGYVINHGDHTGLMLENHMTATYITSDGETQTLYQDILAKSIV